MPSLFSRFTAAARAFRGEKQSIPTIDVAAYRGWGMPAIFKPEQSLQAFGDNVWLYRSVLSIAMEIGSTDFKLHTKNDAGEVEYIKKHQALETLKMPQPTKGGKSMLTSMDLKIITAMHLMLNGEGFWLLDKRLRIGGGPTFIQPLLPQNMFVKIADSGEVLDYTYRIESKEVSFDPMDIVHFKLPDPLNPYRGHSPVQSIRWSVDSHKKADEMNTSKLDNFAAPAGVLESDQAIGEDERKKLLAEWKQLYGGTRNAGKTAMLPKGLKFNATQQTNQEMQFVEGKTMTRDEILANFGIGLEIMGKTESQTRANAEAAIFVFQRFGVLPFLKKFNDTLNNDYLITFPNPQEAEFCFDDPVPQNMEEKRLNAQAAFAVGAITPNEVRKSMGYEALELPGMDTPYMPFNMMPVGSEPVAPNQPISDEL